MPFVEYFVFPFITGRGIDGYDADDAEETSDAGATGEPGDDSISSIISSSSGKGRCSAKKVSLLTDEVPFCRHASSKASRLLVSSQWSTYSHTFLRGVDPVGTSSLAPCSAKERVAPPKEDTWVFVESFRVVIVSVRVEA